MKITNRVSNILTATTIAAIAVVFGASAQAGHFDYASEVNSAISFDGAGHFTFTPSTNNFHVSNGSAVGLLGEVTGTYTIGAISGNTAPVTGTGTFVVHDGANDLSATLQWVDITQSGTAYFLNINGTVNLTNITYAGSNPDLLALKNAGSGINVLSFQFVPAVPLVDLVGPNPHSTSFSGTVAWSPGTTPTPTPTPSTPLTPGYWKNHLAPSGSPGCSSLPYGHCSNNGPWTRDCLPKLIGNFSVGTISLAGQIFEGMTCGSSTDQNAIGCLAGHLLAAKLNRCINSNSCIDPVVAIADTFLRNPPNSTVTFGGYTATSINYTGPTGTYNLNVNQRNLAIALKSAFDTYNNGNGCP